MVDPGMYELTDLGTRNITPEESLINAQTYEVCESEQVRTSTKQLRVILDTKYEKAYLNKVMKTQCQHLIKAQLNELQNLLQKIEAFFNGTLSN